MVNFKSIQTLNEQSFCALFSPKLTTVYWNWWRWIFLHYTIRLSSIKCIEFRLLAGARRIQFGEWSLRFASRSGRREWSLRFPAVTGPAHGEPVLPLVTRRRGGGGGSGTKIYFESNAYKSIETKQKVLKFALSWAKDDSGCQLIDKDDWWKQA